jgi:hypothetical protein
MAVCSEIHTKLINTVCGQNGELLNVKLTVRKVKVGLHKRLTNHFKTTDADAPNMPI